MEKRKAKAACTCAGRESHSGFYCDLEIGYSASVRRARYNSSARQTESTSGAVMTISLSLLIF